MSANLPCLLACFPFFLRLVGLPPFYAAETPQAPIAFLGCFLNSSQPLNLTTMGYRLQQLAGSLHCTHIQTAVRLAFVYEHCCLEQMWETGQLDQNSWRQCF